MLGFAMELGGELFELPDLVNGGAEEKKTFVKQIKQQIENTVEVPVEMSQADVDKLEEAEAEYIPPRVETSNC